MPFLGPTCTKKGSVWVTSKTNNFFFVEMTNADHKLSKTFYFIKISYILIELWMFFYFLVFFCKKGSFPAITVVWGTYFCKFLFNMPGMFFNTNSCQIKLARLLSNMFLTSSMFYYCQLGQLRTVGWVWTSVN